MHVALREAPLYLRLATVRAIPMLHFVKQLIAKHLFHLTASLAVGLYKSSRLNHFSNRWSGTHRATVRAAVGIHIWSDKHVVRLRTRTLTNRRPQTVCETFLRLNQLLVALIVFLHLDYNGLQVARLFRIYRLRHSVRLLRDVHHILSSSVELISESLLR